ncbi:MAG TPA: M15 family metallopeptidase [Clostridiales bacterium]|nr:M15 family metallopeptidase [Clostridiales bacterium]
MLRNDRRSGQRTKRRSRYTVLLITVMAITAAVYRFYAGISVHSAGEPVPKHGMPAGKHTDIEKRGVRISDIDISDELMLVNADHRLDENFAADLTPAYGIIPLSTSDIKINGTVLEAVDRLFADAEKMGYKDFFVNSGFRSFGKQKEIYDSTEDKSYVQEPGASEHQTGYAVDIAYIGLSGEAFGKSPQGKWLFENAHKYGFILRYPEDKTDITKISYEPWHYRYVGIPHSYYCYENDLCLEEYVSFLANGGSYSMSIDKTTYTVYYATDNAGLIDIPADKTCRVSSDNTGGYIVVVTG